MKPSLERRDAVLIFRICCHPWEQHADPPHPFGLLRAPRLATPHRQQCLL
jgi:hypothetical protein